MLVLVPRHVVLTVHVSPVNVGGEIGSLDHVPSVGDILLFTTLKKGSFNTTAIHSLWQEVISNVSWRVYGLGHGVDLLIVKDGVFLLISSDVLNTYGPGVERSSPGARAFNGNIVNTSADTEETSLAPVRTPRVTNSPVFLTILGNTETDD